MSRLNIKILGKLSFSEEDGLRYSIMLPQKVDLSSSILKYESENSIGSSPLTDPSKLIAEDLVVHADHGVGRFKGVQQIDSDGKQQCDFLVLEYAAGQLLYVPIEQIGLIR